MNSWLECVGIASVMVIAGVGASVGIFAALDAIAEKLGTAVAMSVCLIMVTLSIGTFWYLQSNSNKASMGKNGKSDNAEVQCR